MDKSFDTLDQTFDITPAEPVEIKAVKKSKPIIEVNKEELIDWSTKNGHPIPFRQWWLIGAM